MKYYPAMKKEWVTDVCSNRDESRNPCAEFKKPDTNRINMYDSIYIEC